jgi:hypothetical protein
MGFITSPFTLPWVNGWILGQMGLGGAAPSA